MICKKQLKESTVTNLLIAYKNKARCYHSKRKADAIFAELENRLGKDKLNDLRLSVWHLENGEGDTEFNEVCDKLILEFE